MFISSTLTTVFNPVVQVVQNVLDVGFGFTLGLLGFTTPSIIGALNSLLGTTF